MEPAILAGISASIAALISATVFFTNAWLQRRHEFRLKRAQKYEEMAHLISDGVDWAGQVGLITGIEQPKENHSPTAARKALIIAGLYFEEHFYDQIGDYVNILLEYYLFLLRFLPQGPSDIPLVDRAHKLDRKQQEEFFEKIFKQRADIDEKIVKLSKRYST